jgi:hypothetical protein
LESLSSSLAKRRRALRDSVAAFDSYGKALRAKYPERIRAGARMNQFQDLDALDEELLAAGMPGIESILLAEEAQALRWLFQARHVYEHNAGVVDDRFLARVADTTAVRGQLLSLPSADVLGGIDAVAKLAQSLDGLFLPPSR